MVKMDLKFIKTSNRSSFLSMQSFWRNITFDLERTSWLYYFPLDRFIFERESGVWQFYIRNRLFCKHIASIKLLVIVPGNYLILNKHYTLEKMYKWLKIELSFFIIMIVLLRICYVLSHSWHIFLKDKYTKYQAKCNHCWSQ
jgi:hypothetical protein